MYCQSWYECICHHCEAENWLCNGNIDDFTGYDVNPNRYKCWKCGKNNISEDENFTEYEEVEDVSEEGRMTPHNNPQLVKVIRNFYAK